MAGPKVDQKKIDQTKKELKQIMDNLEKLLKESTKDIKAMAHNMEVLKSKASAVR